MVVGRPCGGVGRWGVPVGWRGVVAPCWGAGGVVAGEPLRACFSRCETGISGHFLLWSRIKYKGIQRAPWRERRSVVTSSNTDPLRVGV